MLIDDNMGWPQAEDVDASHAHVLDVAAQSQKAAGSSQKGQKWLLGRVVAVAAEDQQGLGGILPDRCQGCRCVWV